MEGWIKLHRQLKYHWVYSDSEILHIWLHILLSATHDYYETTINGKIVELYPGQLVFGREKWSKALKIKGSKIYRAIKLFQETKMISIYSTNKYSIITVSNWSSYQRFFENSDSELKNEHQNEQQNEQQNEHEKVLELQRIKGNCEQQNEQQNEQHTNTNKTVKKKEYIYIDIFEHWVSQNIVAHRKLTSKMKTKINSTLKEYDLESIKAAIDTYAEIVLDDKYWFTHKWTLEEFLSRGISKFENREVAVQNYLKEEYKNNKKQNKKETENGYDPYQNFKVIK